MKKITLLVSLFICLFINPSTNATSTSENYTIQRVRVDFTSPNGYVRHLLLGFTTNNAATDDFDFGYDAINIDNFPNDMNWMINNERYVVQGVGAYESSKSYPLGLFLTDSGEIEIGLNALENFDQEIPVYVYDSELDIYTQINDQNFSHVMDSGEYINRFYITFSAETTNENNGSTVLSTTEIPNENQIIRYYTFSNELHIVTNNIIDSVSLFDLNGKLINTFNIIPNTELRIPIQNKINKGLYLVSVTVSNISFNKVIHI